MLLGRVTRVGEVVGEGSARRDGPALERVDLEAARDHDAVRRVAVQAPVVVGVVAARVRLQALVALHQKGALTDSEFAAAKAKLLG